MKDRSLRLILFLVLAVSLCPLNLRAEEESDVDSVAQTVPTGESRDFLVEARRMRDLKLPEQALEKYRTLLFRQPQNAHLLKEMGDTCYEAGDSAKAKEYYARALFFRPYDPALRLAYARALYNHQKKDEAIAELRRLLKEDPHFEAARKELALYLSWEGKWKESDEVFIQALRENEKDTSLIFERANVLNWSGQWREAIPLYEEVLRREPENLEALKQLALLYNWTQQWKKSQIAFEELLRKAPPDSDVLEELGNAYYFDQKYEAASRLLGQVRASNPDAARRLSAQMSEISFAMAPTLTYSFLYYRERSKRDIPDDPSYDGPTRTIAESYYHTMEYVHPLTRSLKMIADITSRYDTTIHRTSWIYGMGFQVRLFDFLWHQAGLSWEPKCWKINPRWSLSNVSTFKPRERWEVQLFHRFTTYWDGNKSNSAGFGVTRAFLEKRDLVLGYRFTVDEIDDPSSYFVTIRVPDNENGTPLCLITNTFYAEKYWQLTSRLMVTTGTSYDVTTEGRSTVTIYGNVNYQIGRHLSVVGGTSGSWDNKEIQSVSGSGYLNWVF